MPKIESGPLVGVKGSIGDYTLSGYKGKTILKNKIKNLNENSLENLKKQNGKIRGLSILYQFTKDTIIETSFRLEASRLKIQSGYNLFVKRNNKAFDKDLNVGDYSYLTLSTGNLDLPFQFRQVSDEKGVLSLEWKVDFNTSSNKGDDRLLMTVIYDNDPFKVKFPDIPVICRKNGSAKVDFFQDGAIEAHVYCFFTNTKEDAFTESVYFNLKF